MLLNSNLSKDANEELFLENSASMLTIPSSPLTLMVFSDHKSPMEENIENISSPSTVRILDLTMNYQIANLGVFGYTIVVLN